MSNIDNYWQVHKTATQKVSDHTRTFSLAAIGIIWIFKQPAEGLYVLPNDLIWPLMAV